MVRFFAAHQFIGKSSYVWPGDIDNGLTFGCRIFKHVHKYFERLDCEYTRGMEDIVFDIFISGGVFGWKCLSAFFIGTVVFFSTQVTDNRVL